MADSTHTRQPLSDRDLALLSAYLDDELKEKERNALEARLGADEALQAELEALHRTVALVGTLPQIKAPRNFTLNPADYARPARASLLERLGLGSGLVAAGATLVVVALCVGVYLLSGIGLSGSNAPGEAAADVAELQAQFDEADAEEAVADEESAEDEMMDMAAEAPAEEEVPEMEMAEEAPAAELLAAQTPTSEATIESDGAGERPTPTPSDFGFGGGAGGAGGGGDGPGVGGGAGGGVGGGDTQTEDASVPADGESVAEVPAPLVAGENAAALVPTVEVTPEYIFTPPPNQPVGSLEEQTSFFQRSILSSPLGIALVIIVGLALVAGGVFGYRRLRRRK